MTTVQSSNSCPGCEPASARLGVRRWSSPAREERMGERRAGGIDVSKGWLDLAARPAARPERFPNTAAGQAALVAHLQALPRTERPQVMVVEATGGLERGVVAALESAALSVAVVNPRQVRDFARCL